MAPLLPLLSSFKFGYSFGVDQGYVRVRGNNTIGQFCLFNKESRSSTSLVRNVALNNILLSRITLVPHSFIRRTLTEYSLRGSGF